MTNLSRKIDDLKGSGERAALGIKEIVTALGLVAVASKVFDVIKDSISRAFARIDTMDQFGRVMNAMLRDTKKVNEVLETTREIVTGTAYTLNGAAAAVQNFVTRGIDVDKATGYIKSWGDAVAFYGDGSAETYDRVNDALANMLTKGNVTMDQMNRIHESGIPAVEIYADAVGKSAAEVQEALTNKEIMAEEFVDTVTKAMMEGGIKFASIEGAAKEAGASWNSVFTNMRTHVATGVEHVILAIDKMLTENKLPDMREMVAKFGHVIRDTLKWVATNIPTAVEKIREVYTTLQPWLPLIASITSAVTGMVLAWATFNSAESAIKNVKKSFKALNSVMKANPWLLLVGAIIAAAILVYTYWEPIKEFFINLWESIKAMGLIIWDSLKEAWSSTVEWFKSLWTSVFDFFVSLWNSIKDGAIAIWESLKESWNASVESLKEAWSSVKQFFVDLWNSVLEVIMTVLQPHIDAVINLWNNMKDGISDIFEGFKQYFKAVWEVIKNIFLGAVLLIINLVTGDFEELKSNAVAIWENIKNALGDAWDAIKQIFTGALDVIKGFFVASWENLKNFSIQLWEGLKAFFVSLWDGIKIIFQTVVSFVVNFVKNSWENIKTNTKTAFNNVKTTISNIWNGIKTFFTETLINIWNTVKQKFSDIVNSVREKMTETKAKVEEGWNKAKEFLTGIDLMQIGKDIIQGLIRGITNKFNDVKKKIEELSNAIPDWIKKVLGIASPSKVTTKLGEETTNGLAKGISKKQKEAEKAAKKAAQATAKRFKEALDSASYKYKMGEIDSTVYVKSLENVRNQYAKTGDQIRKVNLEIKKAQEKHAKDIAKKLKAEYDASKNYIEKKKRDNELTLEQELILWENVQNRYKAGTKERIDAEKQVYRVKQEIAKADFESSKTWINRQKKYNEMSLMDELKAWERVQERYKVGTKQREEAEENVYRVRKEIHDKLTSLKDEYLKKMQDVNQKFIEEERKLNEEYRKAVEDRTNSLYNFAGIFDEIKEKSDVSGQQLVENLRGQVETFAEWANNIKVLAERGIDEGLLAELQDMGPKAAAEIAALTTLSDSQLSEYASLWQEKNQLARKQAEKELEGMKKDTDKKILELRQAAETQLTKLQNEWDLKIKNLVRATNSELSTLRQVGEDAGQGLLDGLASMEGPLIDMAQQIADGIKWALQSALEIHSPSRWMRDFIVGNMAKGFSVGVDKYKSTITKTLGRFGELVKPNIDVVNRLRGVRADLGLLNAKSLQNITNSTSHIAYDNSRKMQNTINMQSTGDDRADLERLMRRLEFEFGG